MFSREFNLKIENWKSSCVKKVKLQNSADFNFDRFVVLDDVNDRFQVKRKNVKKALFSVHWD